MTEKIAQKPTRKPAPGGPGGDSTFLRGPPGARSGGQKTPFFLHFCPVRDPGGPHFSAKIRKNLDFSPIFRDPQNPGPDPKMHYNRNSMGQFFQVFCEFRRVPENFRLWHRSGMIHAMFDRAGLVEEGRRADPDSVNRSRGPPPAIPVGQRRAPRRRSGYPVCAVRRAGGR